MLAILISVYSDTLWYGLLCRYKVSQVVPFTLLAPVAGVIAGMYFLDEPLNSHKVYGGILVLSGVILIEIKKLPFNNKGKLVKKD
jgi:O-acetylserine/cysteine efflux transporter